MDKESGYKKLEIYKLSFELSLEVHRMSLGLPKIELFEEKTALTLWQNTGR